MATCTGLPSGMPVVLRIKRKRTGEDPVEALCVASKVRKVDHQLNDGSDGEESIFHLCGSVTTEKHSEKTLWDFLEKYEERKSQVKYNPLAKLSISDSKKQARDAKKQSTAINRYKLLSSLRCVKDEEHSNELHLYDVLDKESVKMETSNSDIISSSPDVITCNSTPLVREKVHNEEDYIYDIYMSHCYNMEEISSFDWNTLSSYSCEPELVHDIFESNEDIYEDEDDSNDEGNWRNDYPDEESDPNNDSSADSYDCDDDIKCYRHRDLYFDELDTYNFVDSEEEHYTVDDDDDGYGNDQF